MDLSIVIPCYNEAGNVPKLRDEFIPVACQLAARGSLEVVVVDDGSRDETWPALNELFKNPQAYPFTVRLLQHPSNRGLGAALKTGLGAAAGEVVVTTDSDGTYRFSEIPALLACLQPGVDLVTASPYHPAGGVAGVPGYRLLLSRGSSLIYRLLLDWHIYTYIALFRAYRRRVLQTVPFQSDGFLAGTELLVNSLLLGFRAAEYPAVLHSRQAGVSKARLLRTILAHLRFQGGLLLRRLRLAPAVNPLRQVK